MSSYLPKLRVGDEVDVEVPATQAPDQALVGHLQEVTSVAVAGKALCIRQPGPHGAGVGARLRRERKILHHPSAVLAVACPTDAKAGVCLTGAADGKARLWDLTNSENATSEPTRTIAAHHGALLCVAFSPDGTVLRHRRRGSRDRHSRDGDRQGDSTGCAGTAAR